MTRRSAGADRSQSTTGWRVGFPVAQNHWFDVSLGRSAVNLAGDQGRQLCAACDDLHVIRLQIVDPQKSLDRDALRLRGADDADRGP
jgi:hypothetical protein